MKVITKFANLKFFQSVITILNNTSFFLFGFYFIIFILFNSVVFSSTSAQALSISNTITFLSIFGIGAILIAFMINPTGTKQDLFYSSGFKALFMFVMSFILYGILFVSFEGRLDTSFVTGFFTDTKFLFTYMFVVAFFEEIIFRVALVQTLKKSSNYMPAVYFVSSAIFAYYHYFKYGGEWSYLIFAFIAGLGFTYINSKQEIGGFPTLPSAIALHLVFNLYSVGALSVVLSMVGM